MSMYNKISSLNNNPNMRIATSMTQSDEHPNESNSVSRKLPRGRTCDSSFDPNTFDIHFDPKTYDIVSPNSNTNHRVVRMADIENVLLRFLSTKFMEDPTIVSLITIMNFSSVIICMFAGLTNFCVDEVAIWVLILSSLWNALGYFVISYKKPRYEKNAWLKRMDCFYYYQKMKEAKSSLVFVKNLKKLIGKCHEIKGTSLIRRADARCGRSAALGTDTNEIFIATDLKAMEMITKMFVEITSRPVKFVRFAQIAPVFMFFINAIVGCTGIFMMYNSQMTYYMRGIYPFVLFAAPIRMCLHFYIYGSMRYDENAEDDKLKNNSASSNLSDRTRLLVCFWDLFHDVNKEDARLNFLKLKRMIKHEFRANQCEFIKKRNELQSIQELYGF